MDSSADQGQGRQLLRRLGVRVDQKIVATVVRRIRRGDTLYSPYSPGEEGQPPVCGKGTVYKITRLYETGELATWLHQLVDVTEPEPQPLSPLGPDRRIFANEEHWEAWRRDNALELGRAVAAYKLDLESRLQAATRGTFRALDWEGEGLTFGTQEAIFSRESLGNAALRPVWSRFILPSDLET